MKIKLLDFEIYASISEEELEKFKRKLREFDNISDSQLLDDIELLDYMLHDVEYAKSLEKGTIKKLALVLYNISIYKEDLPHSWIYHTFNIDKEHDAGIIIKKRE